MPLPPLPPGSRVLELSARDPATGLESVKSAPLVLGQTIAPAMTEAEPGRVRAPAVACAIGEPRTCFTVRVIAGDVGAVRRLRVLADGRLFVLLQSGETTILGSGVSEPVPLGPPPAGARIEVADVAIDPDFLDNRFVYLTVLASFPTGSRTVNVVRLREVNGSLGEAATIIPDLPVSPEGYPSISVGPDRLLYVAMPAAAGAASRDRLYHGNVLRYDRDGRAAGDARTGSPVLAQGSAPQASLVWDSEARPHELRWEGVVDLAQSPAGTRDDADRLAVVRTVPGSLQIAAVSSKGDDMYVSAPRLVSLGELVPIAVTFAASGDLVVAASHGAEGPVDILLLRRAVSSARD